MTDSTADVLDTLEEGDRVLYNTKQTPLTVIAVQDTDVIVEGPYGGEYLLFPAPDDPSVILESQSGNKEYARKVEDLRTVGEWTQTGEDAWKHSRTGATVTLETTDAGYWTLTIAGFSGDKPDVPQYGFTSKDVARDEAEAFMDAHPEG